MSRDRINLGNNCDLHELKEQGDLLGAALLAQVRHLVLHQLVVEAEPLPPGCWCMVHSAHRLVVQSDKASSQLLVESNRSKIPKGINFW